MREIVVLNPGILGKIRENVSFKFVKWEEIGSFKVRKIASLYIVIVSY